MTPEQRHDLIEAALTCLAYLALAGLGFLVTVLALGKWGPGR